MIKALKPKVKGGQTMKTIYLLTAWAMQCHDQSQMRTGNHRNQIGFYRSGNDFLWFCMQAKQNKEAGIPILCSVVV